MAKYLKKKAESLEKLNCNLASETARKTDCQNSSEFMERIACIQVSNSVSIKCRLQTADCRLQTGYKMQTRYKMQTADCRLGIKCRLRPILGINCRLS